MYYTNTVMTIVKIVSKGSAKYINCKIYFFQTDFTVFVILKKIIKMKFDTSN